MRTRAPVDVAVLRDERGDGIERRNHQHYDRNRANVETAGKTRYETSPFRQGWP